MNEMNIPLQEWITSNVPDEKMLWKKAWSSQVCFVRDEIPKFLCMGEYTFNEYQTIRENITVISTHTSKSIKLPVYCIKANGDTFILRNNFYDWKVSVDTHNIHKIDFKKLGVIYNTANQIESHICEGFKQEWIFKSYDEDKWQYTVEINNDFKLKLFFWLIQKKDLIWEK